MLFCVYVSFFFLMIPRQPRSTRTDTLFPDTTLLRSDVIIKISPPTMEEIDMMKNGQVLFSSQQPSYLSLEQLQAMMKKRITAISYEYLRDEGNILTVVRAKIGRAHV